MANTYSQLYIQFIFAVKDRENNLPKKNKDVLHKYISSMISKRNSKVLSINNMPDHIHIFISLAPNCKISDLVRDIKVASSKFINQQNWFYGKFSWQEGYGAFSYSQSQISKVCKYIENQEEHHKRHTFKSEYIDLLNKFDIEYDEKYLFKFD